ncbi:MAG: class I SAM-dependent methyltransferase, partial [Calditrichia bacterium]
MINRFNNLTAKEWLPFQKSWFYYENKFDLYTRNIRFFTKVKLNLQPPEVLFFGQDDDWEIFRKVCQEQDCRPLKSLEDKTTDLLQFALLDLLDEMSKINDLGEYHSLRRRVMDQVQQIYSVLEAKRFICLLTANRQIGECFYPFAWDMAKWAGKFYTLKDEKIGCSRTPPGEQPPEGNAAFQTRSNAFYTLYFRKDERSGEEQPQPDNQLFSNICQQSEKISAGRALSSWYVLKPPPRKRSEILHPAKYPEQLVEIFIQHFTNENQNVFDPMSGTGSTQLAALKLGRNGYGTELSQLFCQLALQRCGDYLAEQPQPRNGINNNEFKILCRDARELPAGEFPQIDYIITSPPYWDMLNMKGAEYQTARRMKGLKLNYSDDRQDLGNMKDYHKFLEELLKIYENAISLLKPGGYFTVVVKNIKKKGKNYPLAWELAERMQQSMTLLPEVFWLQDDIRIAPFGFRYTWVSNTFHQY